MRLAAAAVHCMSFEIILVLRFEITFRAAIKAKYFNVFNYPWILVTHFVKINDKSYLQKKKKVCIKFIHSS